MILDEATKQQLLTKSKNAAPTKAYGTTRYERRNKQRVDTADNRAFNEIDFNALFQGNLLSSTIKVQGETDKYEVTFLFEGICDDLKRQIKLNNGALEYKCVYVALVDAFNRGDVMVHCTCPDWKYRQAYSATKQYYNSGEPEYRPAKITNPNDTAGAGCKHVMCALTSTDWLVKTAMSINNYINYMREHRKDLYNKLIAPKIYDEIPSEEIEEPIEELHDEEQPEVINQEKETIETEEEENG